MSKDSTKLDLRKTSSRSKLASSELKPILSGGEVPEGTSTTEKSVLVGRNSSDEAGIFRKSSKAVEATPPKVLASAENRSRTPEVKKMWATVAAILIAATLLIVPSIFAMFLLYGLFAAFGQSPEQAKDYLNSTKGQFVITAAVELAAIVLVRLYMRLTNDTWQSIGLVWPKLTALFTFAQAAVVYYVLLIISGVLIQAFTNINVDQPQEIGFDASSSGMQLILVFFGLVVLPPIAEEIMFRGFLYTRFKKYYSVIGSALWVSILFCFAHLQLGSGAPPLWAAAIDTFILSMTLVYLREKTGSIIPCIGLHALKNGIAFVMLFLVS